MTLSARGVIVSSLLMFSLATAHVAEAQQGGAAAAQELFNRGRQFLEEKKLPEALDAFTRSQQLDPSVGALINIAEIDEKLGKLGSAWSAWSEAARLALATKQGSRARSAQDGVNRLNPRVGRLSINAGRATGVSVTRNGEKQDPAALNTPVPVDAGHYVIEATGPGKKPYSTAVDVVDGATQTVQIPPLEADNSQPLPVAPPPEPPPSNTQRNVGIGMEIGGGAVLAVGLIFGGVAMGKWNSVTNHCPNAHCATSAIKTQNQSDADGARTLSTISTIGVIGGLAIAAGGVVLHLTAPTTKGSVAGISLTITN